jgi:urea transport system permease protein
MMQPPSSWRARVRRKQTTRPGAQLRLAAAVALLLLSRAALALDPAALEKLSGSDGGARQEAIAAALAAGDAQALPVLEALLDGRLFVGADKRAVIAQDDGFLDAATLQPVKASADTLEKVAINNRTRRGLDRAVAALHLFAPNVDTRLAAARGLLDSADEEVLPVIQRAVAAESDAQVKEVLRTIEASLLLGSSEPQKRILAAEQLSRAPSMNNKRLLIERIATETEPAVKTAMQRAIGSIDASLRIADLVGLIFGGLSLGSILLLASLGLAITFGLMGVINMAHGELLMIGAYATYGVQTLFRHYLPSLSSWYILPAVPAAFLAAALVGMLLEVAVVRTLYGRPLETLLATWGASLLLIQAVRSLVGAQNVEVANPPWMSGGIAVMPGLILPYNRLVILAFSVFVVLAVRMLLGSSRLGLLVRAVTQNRPTAASLGVATPRVDLLAFALGSGIAGLGGCALSQIGNVGPEMGQGFIVDSFMVVVLGGVGQLAGTVLAALGLAQINKLLEPWAGAVLAKIAVLVLVILFIQRRPQGLFALRGRNADD